MPSTTPPLKIILVDDEPMALRVLEAHAQKLAFVEVALTTTSALEGLLFAQQHPLDGIFLDVQMPALTGMQFIPLLGGKANIILTTAYAQYAVQGFEFDVVDYLLKPISFERFLRAIQKLQRQQSLVDSSASPTLLPPVGRPTGVLFIKTDYKLVKVDHDALLYFQGGKDYTTIFTQTETLLSLTSLAQFEQSLPPSHFIRVHKSYLVAIHKIESIERQRIFLGKAVIPIGEAYKDAVMRAIGS